MAWWDRVDWSDPIERDCPLNQGLVGWWMGAPNCYGGTRMQDLCNKNHGTLTNMDPATDWVSGVHGSELNFSGGSDYVSLPSPSLNVPYMVTYVFRHTASSSPTKIISSGSGNGVGVAIAYTGNGSRGYEVAVQRQPGVDSRTVAIKASGGPTAATDTQYHCVSIISDGSVDLAVTPSACHIVVDGVPFVGATGSSFSPNAAWMLGGRGSTAGLIGNISAVILNRGIFAPADAMRINDQRNLHWPDALRWLRGRSMVSVPAGGGGGAPPWLYARRQTQIIGGGMGL